MRRVRIAFDASCLITDSKSGIAYYTEGLILHLASEYPEEVELVGHYCNFLGRRKGIVLPQAPNISYRPTKLLPPKVLNLLRRLRLWIPFELLIKGRADFHLFPAFIGWPSVFKTPSAPIIYDMTYLEFPDFVSNLALHDLKTFVPAAIKRSAFVVTISQASANSIGEHYSLARHKIVVTHIPPLQIRHLSSEDAAVYLKQLGISSPYILFLGNLEPRKNLTVLLAAYKLLEPELRQKFALVLAGGKGWNEAELTSMINDMKQAGYNIILPGYVNDEQRAALFGEASVFVLPSSYEGFGMTLLEAMSYQTPVIASDIAVFHEVCGDATLYFDPGSPEELAAQLQHLASDNELVKKLVKAGKTNLLRFSWQEVTATIYKHIEKVV